MSEFAERYWNRAAGFADFAGGLHLSIFCAEDVPGIADGTADRLTERTFIGRYLIEQYRAACGEWVRAPVDPAFHQPLSAPIPTLLLSGWFDPVTPPETAEHVARTLPASRHIVDPAGGHGVSTGCARPAVLHVLIHGTLDGMPAVCGAGP